MLSYFANMLGVKRIGNNNHGFVLLDKGNRQLAAQAVSDVTPGMTSISISGNSR